MELLPYIAAVLTDFTGFWLWLLLGLLMLAVAGVALRRGVRLAAAVLLVVAALMLYIGAYQLWYTNRPLPPSVTQHLHDGIIYTREIRPVPRPLVIHVIAIDLNTPGLRLLVTPPEDESDLPLIARTTSDFLREFDLKLAVNAGFFRPWWTRGIYDYYPRTGDRVSARGLFASEGIIYGEEDRSITATLYLTADNRASLEPPPEIYTALSGNTMLVADGMIATRDDPYSVELHPRTVIALDRAMETLLLLVVDGRQTNYSEGVNLVEMAGIALDYGAYHALNLDGGGSTTLVMAGNDGEPVLLNSPIDSSLPGRERPVANHFGLYIEGD